MSETNKISGVIITLNEERHIAACIESLQEVVDEIIVVDSFSSDRTKEICSSYNVTFVENAFQGHIQQKNFAVSCATHNWVLALDADERVSEQMKAAILEVKKDFQFDGYIFNRLNNYCGQWLNHCWYPDAKLRLWNRTKGEWGGTNPHDKVIVPSGKVQKLKGDLIHYAYATVEEHLKQIVSFARIAANEKHKKGKSVVFVWHVLLNPSFKFFRKYLLNLGFLDGKYGFIYCIMASFLSFMKYLNLWGLQNNNNHGTSKS